MSLLVAFVGGSSFGRRMLLAMIMGCPAIKDVIAHKGDTCIAQYCDVTKTSTSLE